MFAVLSFLLVAMGLLYAMSAPAVLLQTTEEVARQAVTRAILKNGVEIIVYPSVLLGIATILWNGVREEESK